MNVTALTYLSQAQSCDMECTRNGNEVTCECSNGDSWFTSVLASDCPSWEYADLLDVPGCGKMFADVAADDSDLNETTPAERMAAAALPALYFCTCPARFADAYEGVIRATIIPGMIQGGLILLLVLSACCLMCIPSQRKVIVSRYYAQQATV